MKTFKTFVKEATEDFVNESSLSRVYTHFNSDDTVVLFTAFRGDKSVGENISNNKKVASDLKSNKFGYFFVDGYWIENKGEEDERKVKEDSIFAISPKERSQELVDLTHKLANKYDQDAIFVKTDTEVYLLFNNGSKEKLNGGLKPGKLGDMYTKLKNNKKSNTFVFEKFIGERENYGYFGNLAAREFEKNPNESSLSRVWKHNEEHDCAAFTAFRKAEDCGKGKEYTKDDNKARNKSLLAKLKSKGYGVTKLKGTYPEGGNVGKEDSFFIVDLSDGGNLLSDAKKLGEEFEQDSILFIPKGSIQNNATAFLVGTNRCDNNWLGFGKTEPFSKGKLGYESPIYTSKVNGRPFIFEEVGDEVLDPGNGSGWWSLNIIATKHWKELI